MFETALYRNILLGALYISIAVAILAVAIFAVRPSKSYQARVVLGGSELFVSLADTPALREQGLSGRARFSENEGMLFVFERPYVYGFWMKDMLFPIDIIFFDEDRRIVDVWEHADPRSYPQVFTSRLPALYVLEVSAGFFAKHHLKTGNILEILK